MSKILWLELLQLVRIQYSLFMLKLWVYIPYKFLYIPLKFGISRGRTDQSDEVLHQRGLSQWVTTGVANPASGGGALCLVSPLVWAEFFRLNWTLLCLMQGAEDSSHITLVNVFIRAARLRWFGHLVRMHHCLKTGHLVWLCIFCTGFPLSKRSRRSKSKSYKE